MWSRSGSPAELSKERPLCHWTCSGLDMLWISKDSPLHWNPVNGQPEWRSQISDLASVAQFVGVPPCRPKGCKFSSWSGHKPRLYIQFPVRAHLRWGKKIKFNLKKKPDPLNGYKALIPDIVILLPQVAPDYKGYWEHLGQKDNELCPMTAATRQRQRPRPKWDTLGWGLEG